MKGENRVNLQCLSQDFETGCLKLASKYLRGITIY